MTPFLLHQALVAATAARPDALALVDRDRSWTYRQLDETSNRIAHALRSAGVQRGDRVALYLDKSAESIAAIYGTLKAGACYVPLDPQAPVSRLGYIADDCGVRCVLSGIEKASSWTELVRAAPSITTIFCLNADCASAVDEVGTRVVFAGKIADCDAGPAAAGGTCFDLAYILYTSGSTGRPKGVMLSHLNAMAFVEWAAATFAVGPEDRLSSHAPLHFDLSVFDIFVASLCMSAVVLVPARSSLFPGEIRRFITDNSITIWYSVPSILTMLVLRGGLEVGDLPSVRTLLFAGVL